MFKVNTITSKITSAFTISVVILLLSEICSAQQGSYHFNLVVAPDSIELRKITEMSQDPDGYMWLADQENNCIIRYDGYKMQRYTYNPPNLNSLGGMSVEAIFADAEGKVWFGAGKVLDELDTRTGKFTHYSNKPDDPNSFCGGFIKTILRDRDGLLWVGTEQGLEQLDTKTGKFRHFRHDPGNPASLSCNIVWIIYEDHHGDLWIGTGFPWSQNSDGGLNKLNRKTSDFTSFLHDPKDPHSLVDNKVGAIFEDSKGIFWVGTRGDGLHTMDRQKGNFERHPYDPLHPDQLSRPPLKSGGDIISFIHEDGAGAIWIGTNQSGINVYDPTEKKISHFQADRVFPDSAAWTAFTSRDGELWIASEPVNNEAKHLYRIDPFIKSMSHLKTPNPVSAIHEDITGNIWLGTDGSGLGFLKKGSSDIKIIHLPKDESHFPHENFVISIYEDRKGILWLGTTDGVFHYDPASGHFSRFDTDSENSNLHKNVVPIIIEDHKGFLWIATFSGICRFDPGTGLIKHWHHNARDSSGLNSDQLLDMVEDPLGMIWISVFGFDGLNRFDPGTNIFKHYLQGLHVNALYKDRAGNIWAATNTNLYRYSKTTDQFIVFPGQQMVGKNLITGILEDKQQNLWLNSAGAIFKIDSTRKEMRVFSKTSDKNLDKAIIETSNGKILAAGDNGFYIIASGEQNNHITAPVILVTDFLIDNKKVPADIISTNKIKLAYDQNIFSFAFLAIHYSAPEENNIFYKLEGYDEEWRKSAPDKTASYFKIPTGDYTFRLKATNRYGLESEQSIRVIINPPWWREWWAFCIYGLQLIAISLAFYHQQKKRIVKLERESARERELAQAKEIEKAYHELKTTQAQLVQSEKMASLGALTAGIAHEIQNPLNFVNNFSEVNKEMIAEMKEEIDKGNYEEAKAIADDIEANEEKINHHGKRADAIVKDMLQHSRASTGGKEPVDINDLCDEYIRLAYHGLRAKNKDFGATIKTDFDNTIENVHIIPQDIGRVLLNLFNNAFYAVAEKRKTHGPGYEPLVSLSTKRSGKQVLITVSDNGNGIPGNIVDKIFQPFFTTKPPGQGTGLGLSLSYDIIKAQGGDIRVETKEEQGTTLIVQLPIV